MLNIASKLLERSRKGEVAWQKTVKDTEFIVSFPEYSFVIATIRYSDSEPDYELSLTDERGTKIESLVFRNSKEDGYQALEELFQSARRRALGIDRRLEKALKDLEQGGLIG